MIMTRGHRSLPRSFVSIPIILFLSLAAAAFAHGSDQQQSGTQSQPSSDSQVSGSISGTVLDETGALVEGARVTLSRGDKSPSQSVLTDASGQFSFPGAAPGAFNLVITLVGFSAQAFSGVLHSRENFLVPDITLALAPAITDVQVVLPRKQVAEAEVKEEEKQRVLGFIPNFYVSYVPNPMPLSSKQKFQLAWKTSVDPVTFGIVAGIAGIEQAENIYSGYGQGAQGYGYRFGAAYGDVVAGTFIGSAILPSLLKQDPRYIYKGTGSRHARLMYAIANSVICKGDNGHWQPNYSYLLGSLAAGGISNLYYPSSDRNGVALTFENALLGVGAASAANVLQEFVIRKLTPNALHRDPAKS